jgi:hypothetical protein
MELPAARVDANAQKLDCTTVEVEWTLEVEVPCRQFRREIYRLPIPG